VVLILDGESMFNCMIKMLIGSSLPFSCWLPCMSCFYLCDDHQFIDGSRREGSSWSSGRRRPYSLVFLGYLEGYGLCICQSLYASVPADFYDTLLSLVASWCALFCKVLRLNSRTALLYYNYVTFPLITLIN